jgi:hypothetical protein
MTKAWDSNCAPKVGSISNGRPGDGLCGGGSLTSPLEAKLVSVF